MKIVMLAITLTLLASCSSMNKMNHSSNIQDDHSFWEKEDKLIMADHKRAAKAFDWAVEHVKEHKIEISNVAKSIKQHQEELKMLSKKNIKTAKDKAMQLKFENKHKRLKKEYKHYLSEHSKLMDIVKELEDLKTQM